MIVNSLIDIMDVANAEQQITDETEPDPRTWDAWMNKFINAEDVKLHAQRPEDGTTVYPLSGLYSSNAAAAGGSSSSTAEPPAER